MKKYQTLLCILLMGASSGIAQDNQNLVTNGSFEELIHLGSVNNLVKNWVNVSYFHNTHQFKQQVFQLFKENHQPNRIAKNGTLLHTAEFYAHPIQEENNKNHRSTYYQTILNETLKAKHHYEVIFHVAKSEETEILIPQIGIYLSDIPLTNNQVQKKIYEVKPQLVFHLDRPNANGDWQEMKAVFTAKGGEKYIAIGVFGKPDFKIQTVKEAEDKENLRALYHLDDILVKEVPNNALLANLDSGTVYALNSSILFEVGSYEIKAKATESLDAIGNALRQNSIKVEIAGHTDNSGNEGENLILSQKRAESVMDFLIKGGIDATRLSAKGYGSQRPVADNHNTHGKEKNRRVEFIVKK